MRSDSSSPSRSRPNGFSQFTLNGPCVWDATQRTVLLFPLIVPENMKIFHCAPQGLKTLYAVNLISLCNPT